MHKSLAFQRKVKEYIRQYSFLHRELDHRYPNHAGFFEDLRDRLDNVLSLFNDILRHDRSDAASRSATAATLRDFTKRAKRYISPAVRFLADMRRGEVLVPTLAHPENVLEGRFRSGLALPVREGGPLDPFYLPDKYPLDPVPYLSADDFPPYSFWIDEWSHYESVYRLRHQGLSTDEAYSVLNYEADKEADDAFDDDF